ncbi:MAG: cobinamide kinase [Lachnospiraceae bacterium]|nr:cobinamide kinase [Lachnospiraceae bacterium]
MMILIIGGSGSGKSSYAEKTAVSIAQMKTSHKEDMTKYYLATMKVYDEDGHRKIERHRQFRSGKGFLTIEQPTEILRALENMEVGSRTVLLECISNLTANEMFAEAEAKTEMQVTEKVIKDIEILKEKTTHLVVVSNNIFEEAITYDESTMEYINAMGKINRKLAALADKVVEVVVGIPIDIK